VKSADKADALVNELAKRGENSVKQLYGGNKFDPNY
jgi:ATP-dependent RNA helicase UAP56/SUB2